MKPGQAVKAVLSLEDVKDAVSVPRGAVFEKDGKRVVYKLDGGRFAPVEVTLGHSSLARVVIEKGLSAGDRIALRDPTRETEVLDGRKGRTRKKTPEPAPAPRTRTDDLSEATASGIASLRAGPS
jgi:multidrug efflux pump subunit AcrA (membrane-fusion protein)